MKRTVAILLCGILLLYGGCGYAATVGEMLSHGFEPIGKCLYVYGGGWNEADTGSGVDAMTMGVSPQWETFYHQYGSDYNYKTTRYQIRNGLDCTGYMGWLMYQMFQNQYSDAGYVFFAENMAQNYSWIFAGEFTEKTQVQEHQCGDIMSSSDHAYMVLGECADKSVVFLHASPPNLSLCGTSTPSGDNDSMAGALAKKYMSTYFPECYAKYPRVSRGVSYLKDFDRMRWNPQVLRDPDGYRQMSAEEILTDLFERIKIYIHGERLRINGNPFLADGSTYVPLRGVSEKLGAEVLWNDATKTATVVKDGNRVDADTVNRKILVNGIAKEGYTVYLLDGITYLPIRPLCEALNTKANWEGNRKAVTITE